MIEHSTTSTLISTGVNGLDDILCGGLTRDRLYLAEGTPGTGKTTLGIRFLLAGAEAGETVLYITLSETEAELRAVAQSHGWDLGPVSIFEMLAETGLEEAQEQTMFHPAEIELGETVRGIMRQVDELRPTRVVLDSLSELRLLAQSALRYRRQVLALKQYFSTRRCTVLVLDDKSSESGDVQLHSIAHGVISLEQELTGFGSERRRMHVVKMRGMQYRGGYHDFKIIPGGLCVYPRLAASEHNTEFPHEICSTGSRELDDLLGGGLVPGTATLLNGVAGVGKTTTAIQCLVAALKRGERGSYFLFDERLPTLLIRSAALGLDLQPFIESGLLNIRQIDPSELSPGEFATAVRNQIESGCKFILIDSLNAYLQSMRGGEFLVLQMHELLTFMSQNGVVALLVLGQHGTIGDLRSDVDLSYLADSVIQLRFFEAGGQVRQAISVLKTRTTQHERTIREFQIGPGGVVVGEPLQEFQGVLTGAPTFSGHHRQLMNSPADEHFSRRDEA